ncbi:hypothetical protein FGG08_000247 [Glutinoglossum americanum]|uniref:Replication factor A protein 3 n=1 Tax=Glutinoglossum americanum TaxID=1670608 RepID=A0A9P8IDM0_9PEZI|nr:hypothetical protein FGG08_000247 [Glutinoglossum americanum]
MTDTTPRITQPYLESFISQTVRILGKVVQLRGDQATIDAGGHITMILNRDSHLTVGNAAEIVGKVKPDLTVEVLMSTDFGNNINFNAVEAVVDATHRYKEIFYDGGE